MTNLAAAHFNKLTPAEAERLALLLEEMGEAQHAVGKILRHGYESVNPHDPGGPPNRERLEEELGDVLSAVDMLCRLGDLDGHHIAAARRKKDQRVAPYLHHQ